MNMGKRFSVLQQQKALYLIYTVRYGVWIKPGAIILSAVTFPQRINGIGILFWVII
jgi:hypothetical protein